MIVGNDDSQPFVWSVPMGHWRIVTGTGVVEVKRS